jgi:hypothetical protein
VPGPDVVDCDVGDGEAGQLADPQPGVEADADDGLLARVPAGLEQPLDVGGL